MNIFLRTKSISEYAFTEEDLFFKSCVSNEDSVLQLNDISINSTDNMGSIKIGKKRFFWRIIIMAE